MNLLINKNGSLFKTNYRFISCSNKYYFPETEMKIQTTRSNKNNIPPNVNFLSQTLGVSNNKSKIIFEKYKELNYLSKKDIKNTVELLRAYNYDSQEIAQKPRTLFLNYLTLENRYRVLEECGCSPIALGTLAKYVTVMNKEIKILKNHKILPDNADIQKNLIDSFSDVHVRMTEKITDEVPLKIMRQSVLNEYLKEKLQMNETELDKQWKVYGRLRHKSYKSIQRSIEILIRDFHFSRERIIKNGYLLYGDPDNFRRIFINIKKLGNENIHEICYRRPKILMSSCETLQQTIEHIKAFNIPETAIVKCLEVLTLGSDTVLNRLEDLNTVEEFEVLKTNPRVLRLVHYQNKARKRLDYLNQLKIKCASLHLLSGHAEAFAKFARDGSDRTKGCDLLVFLANIFNKSESDIRGLISRHPNWCHIPVLQVKQCLDVLLKRKFKLNDIYNNIHALLYPIEKILEKINMLQNEEIYQKFDLNVKLHQLSSTEILTLAIYFIEAEFHFTGDGVWSDQQSNQVENFHHLLPDFLDDCQKVYKYGVKPANKQNSTV